MSSLRALVIDDAPSVCTLVTMMLRKLGFEVRSANTVDSAMLVFEEEGRNFDLLVTDIAMPDALGIEAADRMRRHRADLPVVFISGVADPVLLGVVVGDRERTVILPKPFEMAELQQAVRKLLGYLPAAVS